MMKMMDRQEVLVKRRLELETKVIQIFRHRHQINPKKQNKKELQSNKIQIVKKPK
jgi:hypothetical protein